MARKLSEITRDLMLTTNEYEIFDDADLQVKIDGETIMGIQLDNSNQEYFYGAYPIELIIPPQSRLEVTLINVSSSTSREWYAILTGEVYA